MFAGGAIVILAIVAMIVVAYVASQGGGGGGGGGGGTPSPGPTVPPGGDTFQWIQGSIILGENASVHSVASEHADSVEDCVKLANDKQPAYGNYSSKDKMCYLVKPSNWLEEIYASCKYLGMDGWSPIVKKDAVMPSQECPQNLKSFGICRNDDSEGYDKPCPKGLWGTPFSKLNSSSTQQDSTVACANSCFDVGTAANALTYDPGSKNCKCYQHFDPSSGVPPYTCLEDGDIPIFMYNVGIQIPDDASKLPKCGLGYYTCKDTDCGGGDTCCSEDVNMCTNTEDSQISKWCNEVLEETSQRWYGCKDGCNEWTECSDKPQC